MGLHFGLGAAHTRTGCRFGSNPVSKETSRAALDQAGDGACPFMATESYSKSCRYELRSGPVIGLPSFR